MGIEWTVSVGIWTRTTIEMEDMDQNKARVVLAYCWFLNLYKFIYCNLRLNTRMKSQKVQELWHLKDFSLVITIQKKCSQENLSVKTNKPAVHRPRQGGGNWWANTSQERKCVCLVLFVSFGLCVCARVNIISNSTSFAPPAHADGGQLGSAHFVDFATWNSLVFLWELFHLQKNNLLHRCENLLFIKRDAFYVKFFFVLFFEEMSH